MSSQVWGRLPQEAFDNPYEYEIQEQSTREADKLLRRLNECLQRYSMKFYRDDRSAQKAVWMLQLDALDSLRDALDALILKKHRTASKLFRDVVEALDLAAYFHAETEESSRHLAKWYNDEVIPNRVYRDFVKKTEGEEAARVKAQFYKNLSRYTHRTYRALLDGYCLGQGDLIWHDGCHDGYIESSILVLPQTIAMYLAVLADLIIEFLGEVARRRLLSKEEIQEVVGNSLETQTVPRRFVIRLSE